MRQRAIHQQVLAALGEDEPITRIQAIANLRDSHRAETTMAVLQALDAPDERLRAGAASSLGVLQAHEEIADELISHLQHNTSARVRFGCAVTLMRVETPEVRQAYIGALKDTHEKIVQIACMELAHGGGEEAIEALFPVLAHDSWRVRLEACKALITLKAADQRVVSTLESMSREAEAARYDAQIEEFERQERERNTPAEFRGVWGKIGTILEQARQIVAKGGR
jgi:HEAT repeat protein